MINDLINSRRASLGDSPQVNFLNAEFDRLNSTFVMDMYCDGRNHPITFYSKKMNFNEAGDKIYVLLSMIERFLVKENCFLRSLEEKNGRQYLPVKTLEFWRLDNVERQLVLRLYHPYNPCPICYFDLKLKNNNFVSKRISRIYELLALGKVADLQQSRPKRLTNDELYDFHYEPFDSFVEWHSHLNNLYLKYPEKGKIDNYKLVYESMHFANKDQKTPIIATQSIPPQWLNFLQIVKRNLTESQYSFFVSLEFISFDGENLKVKPINKGHYKIMEENFLPQLRKAIDESFGQNVNLEYEIRN